MSDDLEDRVSNDTLATLEDYVREGGYNYPVAWALGFLVDFREQIADALVKDNNTYAVKILNDLVKEIVTGEWE